MKAVGVRESMRVEFLPINTVGKPVLEKYRVWLFEQRRVRVLEPFHVPRPNGGTYIIPKGFEFDGGSIPRWFLVLAVIGLLFMPPISLFGFLLVFAILIGLLIERFGLMLLAFAVHDFSVRYRLLVTADGNTEKLQSVSEANKIMRNVNFVTNEMILIGWVAHIAVVLGAGRAWRRFIATPPDVDWRSLDYGISIDA